MKVFLFVISITCLVNYVGATNYYFSSVSGNDSRTSAEAQDPSTPWKTLNKLNSFFSSLKPGDGVYLKRGETFYGSIIIKQSGTTSAPIFIGAYGSGSRPVITSLVTLTGWVSKGGGIWESASNSSLSSTVNMMLLNGVEQEMGRYPNSDASNRGYLNFESHSGKTSITDNDLNTSINWKGAELVTRPRHWILNRSLITGQSGKKISYTTDSPYEPYENYGYFIQNSIKTLDKVGEWYYDPSAKKLSVYFGSAGPSTVQVATTTNDLVSSSNFSNIVFDNLAVQGSNSSGFFINNGSNIHIQNCDIQFLGITGAIVHGHTGLHIENCNISNSNNNGIDMEYSVNNAVIKNNKILNTATIAGMIQNGEGTGLAIYSNGDGADIEFNEIRNTGFIGITFYGSNVTIKNNLIDKFCYVKDDGGALYSHGGSNKPTNRKLLNNIIMNGTGAGPGTDRPTKVSVNGIYMDADILNVEITGNTVTNCFHGVFLQSTQGVVVKNNTFYDNSNQMSILRRAERNAPRNNTLTDNNCFSKNKDQHSLYAMSSENDISSFGTFDYNYYVRPVDDKQTIFVSHVSGGKTINEEVDLATWQKRYGKDAHSKKSPMTIASNSATSVNELIKLEYNATSVAKSIPLNGNFIDVTGKKYSVSTTLEPFTSLILIKTGGGTPNVAPTVKITGPDNNATFNPTDVITITATAADTDGSITGVDFYNGSTLLGSANTSPYSFAWHNPSPGDYVLTAKATDDNGAITTSSPVSVSVVSSGLIPPVVNITSPSLNATFTEPATVTLNADATDPDGTISKVEFFNGATLLNTSASSPYTFTWTNVAAGKYVLTAVATDNDGLTTADTVSISVTGAGPTRKPPSVSITQPAVNAAFAEPAAITISAEATDNDGTISKVEFFNGPTLLATESSFPYTFNWTNVPSGKYSLTAVATDNDGLTTRSDVVAISVTGEGMPPAVSITSPARGTKFNEPATINMTAEATDAGGSISKVEFFNGTTLLKVEKTAPYTFSWKNVPAGNYTLTAVATDNDGLTTTSGAVSVSVSSTSGNKAPVVKIAKPTADTTYNAPPSQIDLAAIASDADGSISTVEFFNGSTLLKTEHTSPYTCAWKNVPAGNYTITVRATDDDGVVTTSSAIYILVKPKASRSTLPEESAIAPPGSSPSAAAMPEDSYDPLGSNGKYLVLPDASAPVKFRLFPNPAAHTIQIYFDAPLTYHKASLTIRNSLGATIRQYPVTLSGKKIDIDISSLNTGMYLIGISGDNFTVSQKFIKNRANGL